MTNDTHAGPVDLPAGYDDADPYNRLTRSSWWFVPARLRDQYRMISADDVTAERRLLAEATDALARRLYDSAAHDFAASEIRDYADRYGVDLDHARAYLSDPSGRFIVSPEDSARLHQLYDVNGEDWPADAERWISHRVRLLLAERAVSRVERAEREAAANRCVMCDQVQPKHVAALAVSTRTPAAGLPPIRGLCGPCESVIAGEYRELAARTVTDDGQTRRQRARAYLAAHGVTELADDVTR